MITGIFSDLLSYVCGHSSDDVEGLHSEKFNLSHLKSNEFSVDQFGYVCIQGMRIYKQITELNLCYLIIKANSLRTTTQFHLIKHENKLFIFDQDDLLPEHYVLFVDLTEQKEIQPIWMHHFNREILQTEYYHPLKEQKLSEDLRQLFLQKICSNP